jgi:hypothetical protein
MDACRMRQPASAHGGKQRESLAAFRENSLGREECRDGVITEESGIVHPQEAR